MKTDPVITITLLISVIVAITGCERKVALEAIPGSGGINPIIEVANLTILEAPTLDFGFQSLGSVTNKIFTINNSGNGPASISTLLLLNQPFNFSGGTYPGTGGNCPPLLAAGDSCTISIAYQPESVDDFTEPVFLNYSDGVAIKNVALTLAGSSGEPGILAPLNPKYDFGMVPINGSSTLSILLTNAGEFSVLEPSVASIPSGYLIPGSVFPGTAGTCGSVILPGSTCLMTLKFAPTALTTFSGNLSLSYDDGNENQSFIIPVTGQGVSEATLAFNEAPIFDFGPVTTNLTQIGIINLTNSGGHSADLSSGFGSLTSGFSYFGGAYPGTGGTCGSTLAAASSCGLVLLFSPTVNQIYSLSVGFNYNSGLRPRVAGITLKGTGQ